VLSVFFGVGGEVLLSCQRYWIGHSRHVVASWVVCCDPCVFVRVYCCWRKRSKSACYQSRGGFFFGSLMSSFWDWCVCATKVFSWGVVFCVVLVSPQLYRVKKIMWGMAGLSYQL